ncbi:MAG: septum formation initiator family protein [Oscillospiraceae bacterium]|nr:septum formation initiator family protein [Oscillospiraceae bacterium]
MLIVYAITALIGLRSDIEKSKNETEALRQEVADKEAQNAELRYYIENSDDDEVKEDIARDHNYVKQGEKVYRTSD